MTCTRTQEFLAQHRLEATAVVDATKQTIKRTEALALARGVDVIWAMRRGAVVRLDLRKDRPPDAEILAAILGPTGNLRAPAIRRGRTLLVGFDAATYRKVLTP